MDLFKWVRTGASLVSDAAESVAVTIVTQIKSQTANDEASIILAKKGDIIMGTYAGSGIERESVADMIDKFADWIREHESVAQAAAQICSDNSSSRDIVGLFMDASGDVSSVQAKLRDWSKSKCISTKEASAGNWEGISIVKVPNQDFVGGGGDNSTGTGGTVHAATTCKATTVKEGDGCWSVSKACKISQDDFKKYNKKGICDIMQAGDHVCCSAGSLPDFSPQPNPMARARRILSPKVTTAIPLLGKTT